MEILSPGVCDEKIWIGECSRCKAILRAEASELYMSSELPVEHRCPFCESNTPTINFWPKSHLTAHNLIYEAIKTDAKCPLSKTGDEVMSEWIECGLPYWAAKSPSFEGNDLNKPGTLIETEYGRFLIGHINPSKYVGDDRDELPDATIVIRYKVVWSEDAE